MILNIPHSATQIPFLDGFTGYFDRINPEIHLLTDWFTDELFDLACHQRVVTPFSRIFCDVERFEEDEREPMARFGMGMLYERTDSGQLLRQVTKELRAKILADFYRPHHDLLNSLVEDSLLKTNGSLIVDCHSFPEKPFASSLSLGGFRPDFNIGTDHFHTPSEWIEELKAYFTQEGYTVIVDYPYSGSIVPMAHYQKEKRVKSIMLEVNRGIYMDEKTIEKKPNFPEIQRIVTGFLSLLEKKECSI